MANNEPPAGLRSFKRLNHKTYLWTPAPSAIQNNSSSVTNQTSFPNTAGTPPDLILIGSWMNASPRHIAKFTEYYQLIYPSSPILLLTSSMSDFFFNTARKEAADYAPAVTTHPWRRGLVSWYTASPTAEGVRSPSSPNTTKPPRVTLSPPEQSSSTHCRAGLASVLALGPSASAFQRPAGLRGPPRRFFQIPHALGRQTLATRLRDDLNAVASSQRLGEVKEKGNGKEREAVIRKEAPRCYIYSDSDEFILDHDIEDHADAADVKGLKVKKVKFTGTKHVEHMRTDLERYWGAVKGTWDVRA
ncbi:hypothetical protein V1506DRAFT_577755 [Lipomyces tetrasporus]